MRKPWGCEAATPVSSRERWERKIPSTQQEALLEGWHTACNQPPAHKDTSSHHGSCDLLYPRPPLTSKSTLSPSGILGGTKLGMNNLLERGIRSQRTSIRDPRDCTCLSNQGLLLPAGTSTLTPPNTMILTPMSTTLAKHLEDTKLSHKSYFMYSVQYTHEVVA